nr:EAL domain-containing protein [Clostridium perfringens]
MYYDALADIYFNKGEYDLAIESYEKLLDLSKERNDLEHIEKALTGLVRASSNTDEYENKDKYINELLYWERFINKNFSENYYNNSIRKYEFNRTRKENSLIKIVNIIFKFLIIILFLIVFKLKIYYVINKIRLRKKIKRYLDQNMYFLNYQPIVDPKKEKIVGFEALLRLKIEDQVVMPNLIINEIEKADMINDVSIWILNKIISDYGELTKIRGVSGKFYVSMNISLKEIEDIDFIKKLANILKDSKLYNQKIAIEITENNKCKDDATVKNNIEYLRRSGFLVALDDFGVEYSNLSMLEKFNFDIIKLDKCFIENIENSDVNKSIIETSDYLSCTKNKTIVVEGVETINQVDFIKNTNSQKIYIQGYFYSKPLKIEDLKKIDLFNIV